MYTLIVTNHRHYCVNKTKNQNQCLKHSSVKCPRNLTINGMKKNLWQMELYEYSSYLCATSNLSVGSSVFYQRNSANVWLAPAIQDRGISIEMALSIHLDDVLAVGRVDRTTIFYIIFVFLHYSHWDLHRHHCFSRTCVCVCVSMHFSRSNAISATEPFCFFQPRYIYIGLLFQFNRHIKRSVCVVYIPYNLHG